MKFEKLSTNKLNIILDMQDLKERNIDFHSFMSNSLESQNLFFDILKQAEKEIGFITSNYNIHIEAFATSSGKFIFTITRASAINLPKKKKVVYKRKIPKTNTEFLIYSFNSFDDYCNFCSFLNTASNIYLGNSSLVLYNSKYYLILNNFKMDLINSKQFFMYISEFANLYTCSNMFLNILLEHGEKLISKNAIEVGVHYLR